MIARIVRAAVALTWWMPLAASAAPAAEPPTVRVWTSPALRAVVARWQDGIRTTDPAIRIETTAIGSDVAMAGLYTGRAEIALLGREPTASELQAFEWVYRAKPARVEVMTGSLATAGRSPALVVFVHRGNPLRRLTLAQLDGIFSTEHLRGARTFRTWGELGLGGAWSARPIALYGPDATSGTGTFFRHAVMNDSRKLDWERMHEFADRTNPDGSLATAADQIAAALARDPYGIAIGALGAQRAQLRPVALAAQDDGPYVDATAASVASRRYPLARAVVALVHRVPGAPDDPAVDALLRYVLSDAGRADVAAAGDYFPLSVADARTQLAAALPQATPAAVAGTIYAQQLVDDAAAANPDVAVIAIAARRPSARGEVIVASNAGRIGIDANAFASGDPARVWVQMPLNDTSGAPVGTIEFAFASAAAGDRGALRQRAERLRDALARRILNAANLLDPYPYDPAAATKTHAQRLVDRAMAAHPELLSLAMHLTLPESGENAILGSSFGRIGKKADDDDMKVITSGRTLPGVYANGTRYGLELALRDARGRTIGALSVAYAYRPGEDQAALLVRAERLRDELRAQFSSVDELIAPDP